MHIIDVIEYENHSNLYSKHMINKTINIFPNGNHGTKRI